MRGEPPSTSNGSAADANRTRSSGGGRVFLRIMLTVVTLITAAVCLLLLSEWRGAQQSHHWLPVTVTIEESSVTGENGPDSTGPYRLHLRYTYDHAGAARSGSEIRLGAPNVSDDVAPLFRIAHRYWPGDRLTGLVDPADPDRAVLQPGGKRGYLVFAFIIGAVSLLAFVGFLATFRHGSSSPGNRERERMRSIARRSDGAATRLVLGIFFTAFLLIGGTLTWFITFEPMARARTAQQWTEVECRIIDSKVRTHHGDSTTYSADVLFEYVIADRTYRSNRAIVRTGSSSAYGFYRSIVNQNPAGRRTTCYVNPADLYEAVLDRSPPSIWSPALIALIFPLVGAIGLVSVVISGRRAIAPPIGSAHEWTSPLQTPRIAGDHAQADEFDPSLPSGDPANRILRPRESRVGKIIVLVCIACIWNGMISFLVFSQLLPQWRSGFAIGTLLFSLFVLPFVAIGLFLIGAIFHSAFALLNPRFTLELDHAPVRLGDSVTVTFQMSGRRAPIRALTFRLIGRESATYQHGSSTSTDRHEFVNEVIFQATDVVQQTTGSLQFQIPAHAVPSFAAQNNKIEWMLTVHGDIPRWPDVAQEYPIHVLPAEEAR